MEFDNILEKLIEWGALYGTKIIGAFVILVIGRIVTGIISKLVHRLMVKSSLDNALVQFATTLTRITMLTFVVLAALSSLGVETTSFIAILGAAGLAIGFALQGSLSNFASGIMLIIFQPFKSEDLVEAGGHLGVVREINVFHTVIISLDNKRIIIPNGKITGDSIINYSAEGSLRVDMVFGIAYHDNISKAKGILEDILKADGRVLDDPPFTVVVKELGNSSVDFAVRPFVKVADYWAVYYDTTEKVKKAFDEKGVTIPFPQRDVHFYKDSTEPILE